MPRPPHPFAPVGLHVLRRTWKLLLPGEKKKAGVLFAAIAVNSLVELLGLAAVLPVVGLVMDPAAVDHSPFLGNAMQLARTWGIERTSDVLFLLCGTMVLAFLAKAGWGLFVSRAQARFAFGVAHRISGVQWDRYFQSTLEHTLSKDSGHLLAEINAYPFLFANSFLAGGLLVVSECAVLCLIAAAVLVFHPWVFLCIFLLMGAGSWLIRSMTQRRLTAFSAQRSVAEPATNALISDAYRGILELLTFRAGPAVRAAYLRERKEVLDIGASASVIATVPAKLYEVLAVIAVAGAIGISLAFGPPHAGFVSLISVLALSAYRVLPSISRISSAFVLMHGHAYVLDTIENAPQPSQILDTPPLKQHLGTPIRITLHNLTLGYTGSGQAVLRGLSGEFAPGEMHAIVGPSGAGKSTLIRALLGLHTPQTGTIQLNSGTRLLELGTDLEVTDWLGSCAYVGQHPFFFRGTVAENLTLRVPGVEVNTTVVEALFRRLQMEECLGKDGLNFLLHEGATNLSGGQQQRLALVRALQLRRPVLIVDEATSALDDALRRVVADILAEEAARGATVLVVTHDMELAARCTTCLRLHGNTSDWN